MNSKRILSAVVILALAVGCAWGSTETSGTHGFAVIPDNEAVRIVGGSGRACNIQTSIEGWYWCDGTYENDPPLPEWDCWGSLTYFYERWACGDAPSGECYETQMILSLDSSCVWYPEYETCAPDNNWHPTYVQACQ
jgi:hypothetical protein